MPEKTLSKALQKTAKVMLFKGDGKILLLRDKRNYWDFPGGEQDKNERTLESCAKRETLEETGISIKKSKLRFIGRGVVEGKLRYLFTASVKGSPKPKLSPEHTNYQWIEPKALPHKKMKPQAKKLLSHCKKRIKRSDIPKKKLPQKTQIALGF